MSYLRSGWGQRAGRGVKHAFGSALMGAALVLGAQSSAEAQNFSDFYIFGDSMSDPGNLHAMDPRQFGSPYWQGRPSNGPTWADYLPGMLNISDGHYFNFAIAGATIGNSDDITSLLGPYQIRRSGPIPNAALVGLNGGGNGISYAIRDGSLNSQSGAAPFAQKLVDEMSTAISRLHAKGGRTFIVMNQQDLGEAPAIFNYDPAATALASYAVRQYDAALTPAMMALSEKLGVKIIVVDVLAMNDVAKASLARYGITNWDRPCIDWFTSKPTGACGTVLNKDGTLDAPGAAKWDGVHMTTMAQQGVAAFTTAVLYSVLEGPQTFNYVQRYALGMTDLAGRQTEGRMGDLADMAQSSNPVGADMTLRASQSRRQGLTTFAQIGYQAASRDAGDNGPSLGFDHKTQTGLIGLDYSSDGRSFAGAALGYLNSRSSSSNGYAGADLTAYSASAYGVKAVGALSVSGTVGAALYRFQDLQRWTGSMFEPVTHGDTDGTGLFASVKAGYSKHWGPSRLEAFGAVRVNQVKIDAYQETGAHYLSMAFGDREASQAIATVGLAARRSFSTRFAEFTPALTVSVDRDLSQSAKDYHFGFVGGQTFDAQYQEPNQTIGRAGIGFKAQLGNGLGLDLSADTAFGGSSREGQRAAAQLTYRF